MATAELNSTMRPVLKPSVIFSPTEDSYLAYDIHSDKLHRLNPLAALIAELADGKRTRDEILQSVAPFVEPAHRPDCEAWIAQAVSQGILADVSAAEPAAAITAEELTELATKLRNTDRVLAAFLCQQRATELSSDDPNLWYKLGELAHIVGRRDIARTAYERYQASYPDDAEVEHLLIALRDETPPPRASDRCIEQLYEHFASFYDENMCGDLDYRAPDLLFAALAGAIGSRRDLDSLDLGCGTGLFGIRLKPSARRLVGIDLSTAMIERAEERGIYDRLEKAELTEWLGRYPTELFDVIAICDTLIYFGDLNQVLPAASRHLKPHGILGFTVEKGEAPPFRVTDNGRFTHHQEHLLAVANTAGYHVVSQTEQVLRYEYGQPVVGWVTVLAAA